MALAKAPLGTYTLTQATSSAAKAEIVADLNSFKALLPSVAVGFTGPQPSPDMAQMNPSIVTRLNAEIDALIAVINAGP